MNENDDNQIILGRQIAGGDGVELDAASLKGAQVGDKVAVTLNGVQKSFTVKGIFYTKFLESDDQAYITQTALKSFISDVSFDNASVIKIKTVASKRNLVLEAVKSVDSSLNVHLWTEAAGITKSASKSFVSINIILTIVGTVVAAATIFIVIYVDIINRRRQIGILRAIGIRPAIITASYVILAIFYVVLGIMLGSLLYYFALAPFYQLHPIELPLVDVVLNLSQADYISRIEIVSIAAAVSGLIPAIVVTRTKMIDAIIGR